MPHLPTGLTPPRPLSTPCRRRYSDRLTMRQLQCLCLASQGWSSRQIAVDLSLSHRTVQEHLMNACSRLGVATSVQAVARLIATGDIERL